MKTICISVSAILLLALGIVLYSVAAGADLLSIEEFQMDDPNQRQIEFFLECCDIQGIQVESADCLLISKSPHRSDSVMAMVFDGDAADWWGGFVNDPEGRTIRLPNHNELCCSAEKLVSTFVWAYRVPAAGGMKSVLRVSNVSGETIDQMIGLQTIS